MEEIIFSWKTLGQNEITDNLFSIFKENKIPSSIIFHGAKGSGKMALAKDFSRLINCQNLAEIQNDNCFCISCKKIYDMTHPDFMILEKSSMCSNNSCCKSPQNYQIKNCVISEFILSKSKYNPFMSNWRVVVVNEANNLSKVSAESLLKTLEEPGSNIIIILLIENLSDLQSTIISRCTTWKMKRVMKKELNKILLDQHPDKEKEILEILSFGSPTLGESLDMLNDSIFFEERQESLKRIIHTIKSPMSEKLNYSKELSMLFRKDNERVFYELKVWKNIYRQKLSIEKFAKNSESLSLISNLDMNDKVKIKKNLENIIEVEKNLRSNIIPSLVLDNLMINLEA